MKHLVSALPRIALLAAAFVAVTAVWGIDAETTRAAALPVAEVEQTYAPPQEEPEDDDASAYALAAAGVVTQTPQVGYTSFGGGDGQYHVRVLPSELTVTFYALGSDRPAWTATVSTDAGADLLAAPDTAARVLARQRVTELVSNLPSDAKIPHDSEPHYNEYVQPQSFGFIGDVPVVGMQVRMDTEASTDSVTVISATLDLAESGRYAATVRGAEIEVRFYRAGMAAHDWSAVVELDNAPLITDQGFPQMLVREIGSITDDDIIPNPPAAALPVSTLERDADPQQAAPDEGGTGVNNFDREEWYEFSILLAPFLVLVTFILALMFMWDRHSGEEG